MPFWWDIDCLAPSRLLHAPVAVLPVLTPVLVTKSLYNRTLSFLLLDLFSQQPSSRSNAIYQDSWGYPSPVPPLYLRFASSRPAGCWELDYRTEKPLQSMDITVFVDMSAVWHISTHWNLSFWHISTCWDLSFYWDKSCRMRDLNALKCARVRDLNTLKCARMRDLNALRYAKLLTYLQIPFCPLTV